MKLLAKLTDMLYYIVEEKRFIFLLSVFVFACAGIFLILFSGEVKYVLPFLAVLGNLSLGLLVWLNDRKNNINISYALTALFTACWAAMIFFYSEAKFPADALFWGRVAAALYACVPIPFLYFFSVFPREDDIPRTYQMIAWIALAAFFACISFSELILKDILETGEKFVFAHGPAFPLFVAYFLGFVIFAFYRLSEKYLRYKGEDKRQISYVLFGFFLGTIFPIITNLFLPLLGYSNLASTGPFSTLITIALLSYAITKHRLMDISVIISRTAAELLATGTLLAGYLTLTWGYRAYFSINIDLGFIIGSVLYGILIGQTHQPLRLFFQTTADRVFLRGKYDYYNALANVGTSISKTLSMENILTTLDKTFREEMEVKSPRVYLADDFNDPEVKEYLGTREIYFDKGKNKLVIPCSLEDRLIALIVLGPKLSEDAYTGDDLKLLKSLSGQVAIAVDHTRSYEKIKKELDTAQIQLDRSQRLASLGMLAAGVAHEIRNPLTVIQTETDLLAKAPRDKDQLGQFQELITKHVKRITSIIRGMLNLSKSKEAIRAPLNLNEIIESTLEFFTISGIELKKRLSPLPSINGSPEELKQVFINLFDNAARFMPGGGKLTIETGYEEANQVVICVVSDTGEGISGENLSKIFDPFFSTRHEGVGLGLSIVYRIIRQHGGTIEAKSELTKGTSFILKFPASPG